MYIMVVNWFKHFFIGAIVATAIITHFPQLLVSVLIWFIAGYLLTVILSLFWIAAAE